MPIPSWERLIPRLSQLKGGAHSQAILIEKEGLGRRGRQEGMGKEGQEGGDGKGRAGGERLGLGKGGTGGRGWGMITNGCYSRGSTAISLISIVQECIGSAN